MDQTTWEFARDHILPRITQLEEEVRLLRKFCWPLVQALREENQLGDLEAKREFLRGSCKDLGDAKDLLREKALISQRLLRPRYSTSHLTQEEIDRLFGILEGERCSREHENISDGPTDKHHT
jgi:hypothetical protein